MFYTEVVESSPIVATFRLEIFYKIIVHWHLSLDGWIYLFIGFSGSIIIWPAAPSRYGCRLPVNN
jgi:hypothetical protein